ncbi:hypothetical protein V8D89_014642 [Ganoderma adspersum]
MPGLVADATRVWELNLYWPLHAQCGVWDPKGKGVDITPPPALSPQTTSTGDTSRADETHSLRRVGVFASAIHLRSGDRHHARQEPHYLIRSSRAYTEEAPPSSLLGRRLLFHPSAPPPSSRSPPSPFTSRIARYPTSKALP